MFKVAPEVAAVRKKPRPWIALRRKLRIKAEKCHKRPVDWRGGILYFTGTNDFVPNVQHVAKPAKKAIGYKAAEPQPAVGYEQRV